MKSFLSILALFRPYRGYVILNLLCNFVSILFSLVSLTLIAPFLGILFDKIEPIKQVPVFSGQPAELINYMIDQFYYQLSTIMSEQGKLEGLLFICGIVITAFFVKNLFRYCALYFLAPIRNGVIFDLRNTVFEKVLSLPVGFYSDQKKGDILARNTVDVQEVEWGVLSVIELIFREPLTITLYIIALFFISPQLTLMAIVILPLTGIIIGGIGKSLKKVSTKAMDQLGQLLSTLEESMGGIKIVKAFGAEKMQAARFASENKEQEQLMNSMLRRRYMASPLSEFLGICVVVIVLYFGGRIVLSNTGLPADLFITFMVIFSQIINPAKAFTNAYYHIVKGIASMQRIEELLQFDNEIKEQENALAIDDFVDSIEYRSVGFAYDAQRAVLDNISWNLEKGRTLALVGQSGSGKTTLADLLPRFYDCTKGGVFLDGKDIREYRLADLRALIGVVTQEPILFNDSVYNNIAFGVSDATREAVKQAAEIANASAFINKLEKGYDTNIGEAGKKLSGGERQRLTIARAILRNPPILILDEATSSLDSASEKLVQDALQKLMKSRTSIVIAHRLSTVQKADKILVMQDGKIVESGNHQELLAKKGNYFRLVELQAF